MFKRVLVLCLMASVLMPVTSASAGVCAGPVVCFDEPVFENAAGVPGAAESGDQFGEVVATGSWNGQPVTVFGSPSEDVGSAVDAGVITIQYSDGTYETISQGSPGVPGTVEPGDRFGASVAVDSGVLYIGVPGEDVGSGQVVDAGMVMALDGAGNWSTVHQNSPGVPGAVEAGDQFGEVLVAESELLWVGAPHEDIGSKVDAGQVWLRSSGEWFSFYEGSPGVLGVAEAGDRFGASISFADVDGFVAIGAPGEDIGSIPDAGVVHFGTSFTNWQLFSENTPGVPGVAEAGDQFGEVLYWSSDLVDGGGSHSLVVGSPHEDIGSKVDAGAFHVWAPDSDSWSVFSQSSPGVPGVAESGDLFGSSFVTVDLDSAGLFDLAVGVPGEAAGSKAQSGGVTIWNPDLDEFYWIDENTPGVAGSVEAGDQFGSALSGAQNNFLGLAVSVPGEDYSGRSNAGLVHLIVLTEQSSGGGGGLILESGPRDAGVSSPGAGGWFDN